MNNYIIFGKSGSGKDAVSKIIQQHYDSLNISNEIIKLGGEIRKTVDDLVETLNINKTKKRQLYIEYGQGMRNIFDANIWNIKLYNSIKNKSNQNKWMFNQNKWIIGDGRQLNELNFWTIKNGFIPIGVHSTDENRKKRLINRDGYDQSMIFDNETDNQVDIVLESIYDIYKRGGSYLIINNNGSLEDLKKEVYKILKMEILLKW